MAKQGEKLTTLDNTERSLTEEDIVISDGEKAIGLAGVMGGLDTEISENTKNVIIEPAIYESMKSAIANYTAEELVTKRQEVSNMAQETLTNKLRDKGINITSLSMTDLSFSKEFDEAIEKKQVVEQQTQQAKYELEKAKVENEKKIENAKAEAEVMKQQNQEITEKTLELKKLEVQQKLIEKWNGQLPSTTLGENIPMLNIGK